MGNKLPKLIKIIRKKYPDFYEAWFRALGSKFMHLGSLSIMRIDDWKQMQQMAWDICQEYLKHIGGDIEKHVKENPEAYRLDTFTVKHQMRVGGQFMERINSAFVDWKFPNAMNVPLVVTQVKIDNPFCE